MATGEIDKSDRTAFLAILLILFPWLAYIWRLSLNADTLWLAIGADRFLDGESMAEGFYDNNPPLSVLIYILPAAVAKYTAISFTIALHAYMLALIGLSFFACRHVLKNFDFISSAQKMSVLCGMLAASTIMTSLSYSERDHILFLGLFPLCLMQLGRSWGYRYSLRFTLAVSILGAAAILLKPAFLLAPALLQLHRWIYQKKFAALFSLETWVVALTTFAYAALLMVFFRDYIEIIMPDVAELYLTNIDTAHTLPQFFQYSILILVFLVLEATGSPLPPPERRLLTALYMLALLCMAPFLLQMKGFYYQLIPAIGFFYCGFALSLESYLRTYAPAWLSRRQPVLIVLILLLACVVRPPLRGYPTGADYKTLPLTMAVKDVCGSGPCQTYFLSDTIETVTQTEFYNGLGHASRFGAVWFLPPLENGAPSLSEPRRDELRRKYIDMTAKDFARYHPDVLAIKRDIFFQPGQPFQFIDYFSASPLFSTLIKNYRLERKITFDRSLYFKGTAYDVKNIVSYDMYRRIPDAAPGQ